MLDCYCYQECRRPAKPSQCIPTVNSSVFGSDGSGAGNFLIIMNYWRRSLCWSSAACFWSGASLICSRPEPARRQSSFSGGEGRPRASSTWQTVAHRPDGKKAAHSEPLDALTRWLERDLRLHSPNNDLGSAIPTITSQENKPASAKGFGSFITCACCGLASKTHRRCWRTGYSA
jgi:hypothetical protein